MCVGVGQSELAVATLAVAGVGHALSHETDELSGLEQSLSLAASADTRAVHEHARHLRATATHLSSSSSFSFIGG